MNKIEVWHSGGTDINAEHPPGADSSPSPCSEFLDWSAQAGYSSCTSDIQLAIWEGWKAGQEHARKTNGDESKVGPWLLSYYTEWHGEMRTWKKRRKDSFYRDIATLTLFCKDYHFPNVRRQVSLDGREGGSHEMGGKALGMLFCQHPLCLNA